MSEVTQNVVSYRQVSAKDLPLHCPAPDMVQWNAHPRVFLDIARTGEASCPYCGTRYKLLDWPLKGGHH